MAASQPEETCWSLVARAGSGDGAARSAFARSYMPLVRAFLRARWRRSSLLAEIDDALQETFVECFRPDGPLTRADSERGEFRGYLHGIVRCVALRFEERHARTDGQLETLPGETESRDEHASRSFDREWARDLMRRAGALMEARALAGGPGARQRVDLLRLRFGENLPIREIAARWGSDIDAVHRAYARSRAEFHSCLRQIVTFHTVRAEGDLDAECKRLFAMLE